MKLIHVNTLIVLLCFKITSSKFLVGEFAFKNSSEFDVTMTQVTNMEKWVGKNFSFSVVQFFTEMCPAMSASLDWYTTYEIRYHLLNIWNAGKIPLFTWQPVCYDPSLPTLAGAGYKTPDTFLKEFPLKQQDAYLTKVATEIKSYISGVDGQYGTVDDRRVYIRLGHEMNGNYYQWNVMENPNILPSDYITFWRYTRQFFDNYLGNNTKYIRRQIQWVWCPNNFESGNLTGTKRTTAEQLYPGNDVVVRSYIYICLCLCFYLLL